MFALIFISIHNQIFTACKSSICVYFNVALFADIFIVYVRELMP